VGFIVFLSGFWKKTVFFATTSNETEVRLLLSAYGSGTSTFSVVDEFYYNATIQDRFFNIKNSNFFKVLQISPLQVNNSNDNFINTLNSYELSVQLDTFMALIRNHPYAFDQQCTSSRIFICLMIFTNLIFLPLHIDFAWFT